MAIYALLRSDLLWAVPFTCTPPILYLSPMPPIPQGSQTTTTTTYFHVIPRSKLLLACPYLPHRLRKDPHPLMRQAAQRSAVLPLTPPRTHSYAVRMGCNDAGVKMGKCGVENGRWAGGEAERVCSWRHRHLLDKGPRHAVRRPRRQGGQRESV